jgi:outer membrane protease
MPEIGGGLFTASTEDYNDPSDYEDKKEKLTAEGIYVNGSLGLGYHFTPMISFFVKGGFCMKLAPSWDADIDTKNYSKDFKTIEGISIPVFAGLRFRF